MKKKISAALILAIALILLTVSAAVAAGLGLFGELAGTPAGDDRLQALDEAAEAVGLEWTTDDGVTLRVEQAYFEGARVFISYRVSGAWNRTELHDGAPEGAEKWANPENAVAAESLSSDIPERQEAILRLDGTCRRWAEFADVTLHDGLFLADGSYLDIIGGDSVVQPDGSLIGWKECEIPEDALEETMTFRATLFRTRTVLFQDGPVLRTAYERGESTSFDFTLTRNTDQTRLTGDAKGADYAARAELSAGHIDLRGTVTVACPSSWTNVINSWENADGVNLIWDWHLYRDGALVDDTGVDGFWAEDDTHIVFELVFSGVGGTDGLTLVPVYRDGEPRPAEGIALTPAD